MNGGNKMLELEALKHIFAEDKTILLTGSKGDGKSNTASKIQETLIELLGYHSWTNIHFIKYKNIKLAMAKKKLADIPGHVYVEKSQQITVVKSLSDLLLGIVDSVATGKVFILDEGGIHADSSHATGKATRTIKQLNRIIRHFECCFIVLTQTKGSVPPDLREKDVDYHFRMKEVRGEYILDIGKKTVVEDGDTGEEKITFPSVKKIKVPPTKYPYDGKFPTGFKIDIDLKYTLDELSEIEDSIELMDRGKGREVILRIIEEGKEGKKVKVTKKEMVLEKLIMHPDESSSAIAALCGCALRYVQQIKKEMKGA